MKLTTSAPSLVVRGLLGAILAVFTVLPVGEAIYSERVGFDPVLGGGPMPGKVLVYRVEGNGRALYTTHHIRREGLPGKNDRPIILVMGDSITEAIQVKDTETYTHLLEENLRQSAINAFVLNAGVSGRSMADYVGRAEEYKNLFHPDWVIIQVDWGDFEEALARDRGPDFPYFITNVFTGNLEVSPVRPARRRSGEVVQTHLPNEVCDFFTFAYPIYRLRDFREWTKHEAPWFHALNNQPGNNVSHRDQVLPITAELEMLNKAWDGRVTLFLVTSFNPLGHTELNPTERQIDAAARKIGLSIVRLDEGFCKLPKGAAPRGFSNTAYNSGHLNSWGHRIAGEILSSEVKRIAASNGLF